MDSVESAVTAYMDALNSSDVEGLVGTLAEDGALGNEMDITFLEADNVIEHVSRELVLRKSADGWRITDYMFDGTEGAG